MLDQCGAVLDPITVVEVQQAVVVAHRAEMDVAADLAVKAECPRAAGRERLVSMDIGSARPLRDFARIDNGR